MAADKPKAPDAAKASTDGAKAASADAGKNPSADEIGKALRAHGVNPAADTASGIAARGEVESPAHDHEGGEGADEIEDTGINPGKPQGAQTQPALFVANGSIPHASVPSPTGLVPATVAGDAAEAALEAQRQGLLDAQRGRTGRYKISREYAESMTPAELRAVASDRGYDVGEGGRRVLVDRFIKAQDEDEGLTDPPKDSPYARGGTVESVTVPGPTGAGAGTSTAGRPAVASGTTQS